MIEATCYALLYLGLAVLASACALDALSYGRANITIIFAMLAAMMLLLATLALAQPRKKIAFPHIPDGTRAALEVGR